jgi:hypothetical protein
VTPTQNLKNRVVLTLKQALAIKALVKTESCAFILHPAQWKDAEIILILKPGKSNELTSCLPTSLLPTASKGFEKLLLKKVPPNG